MLEILKNIREKCIYTVLTEMHQYNIVEETEATKMEALAASFTTTSYHDLTQSLQKPFFFPSYV